MRSFSRWFVLLASFQVALSGLLLAQAKDPPASPGPDSATEQEVEQLRSELAAQRKTIEELTTQVRRLAGQNSAVAHVVDTSLTSPVAAPEPVAVALAEPADKPGKKDKKEASSAAGFNGEHFFIKSSDGKLQIQPYGYLDSDYRAYNGDGAPPNSFVLRRARLGFQGNYGSHYEFAVLIDAAATTGSILRDMYVNVKTRPAFQIQAGQFKEPFAQEIGTAASNLDFVERSLASLLYPSAASAFRSPGFAVHGDLSGGAVQYWVGAFNGKGYAVNNTTSEPEIIGRLRFSPWKKKDDYMLQGLSFSGSIGHGRSRGLSNEQSFSGALPDAAYNFFPSFTINGGVQRYNGELTYLDGPFSFRAEYDQLNQARRGVGAQQSGALGFTNLPAVIGKAWAANATYLLTGEKKPENGTPKVKHALGPEAPGGGRSGLGAWELGFRYAWLQAKANGITDLAAFTPSLVPTFQDHTDEFTIGLNWYPNYWVRYMLNFNVDRLKDPSFTGALPQNYFVVLQRLQFRF